MVDTVNKNLTGDYSRPTLGNASLNQQIRRFNDRKKPKPYAYDPMAEFQKQSPAYYNATQAVTKVPLDAYHYVNNSLNSLIDLPGSIARNGIRNTGTYEGMYGPAPDTRGSGNAIDALANLRRDVQEKRNAPPVVDAAPPTWDAVMQGLGSYSTRSVSNAPAPAAQQGLGAFEIRPAIVDGRYNYGPGTPLTPNSTTAKSPMVTKPVTAAAPTQAAAMPNNGSYWIDSSGKKREITWDAKGNLLSGARNANDPGVQADRKANNAALLAEPPAPAARQASYFNTQTGESFDSQQGLDNSYATLRRKRGTM